MNKTAIKLFGALIAAALPTAHVLAAGGNWTNLTSSVWSAAANWNPNVVPGTAAGDAVSLTNNIGAALTITLDQAATVGALNIGDSGSTYYAFTLTPAAAQTLTFNNNGNGASLVQAVTTATDTNAVPVILNDNLAITNSSTLMFSGNIDDGGLGKSIAKSGSGKLILSGSNTFSGGFTINAGTVLIQTNAGVILGTNLAFGAGPVTANGTCALQSQAFGAANNTTNNLNVSSGASLTLDVLAGTGAAGWSFYGKISGPGAIARGTSSSSPYPGLNFYGDNSGYTGIFTIPSSGNAVVNFSSTNSGLPNGALVCNQGTAGRAALGFTPPGIIQFGSLTGGGILRFNAGGGVQTLQVGNLGLNESYTGYFAQGSSCHGAIVKVGTGAWTLSGASAYDNPTTVENGALVAGANVNPAGTAVAGPFGNTTSAIALGDALSVTNTAAMNPQLYVGGAFTMGRAVTVGTANVLGNGSSTFTLGGNTANSSTFSGAIALNQSLVVTQAAGGTLTLSGGMTNATSSALTVTFNHAGSISNSTAAIDNGSAGGTVALTQNGTGTLTLSAANTYTGNTTVNGGTLLVNGSTASGSTVSVSGGSSVLGGAGTVGGNTTISGGALTPRAGAGSATTLTISGSLTLSSAAANFTVSSTGGGANDKVVYGSGGSGTLTLNNTDTINITNSGGLDIAADYVLFANPSGGTVSLLTPPTLKTNGVTVTPGPGSFVITNYPGFSSVVLHYLPVSTAPTVNSAGTSPASLGHYQTTTVTVNVTPASGKSVTNLSVTVDGLSGAGDPVELTGPGGNGSGNWTGTFTAANSIAANPQTIGGLVRQNDGSAVGWSANVTVTNYNDVWSGGGVNNKWSTGGNWSVSYGPGAGDTVAMDGATQMTNNLDSSLSIAALTFNSGAGSFDITNGNSTLTLSGGVTNNSTSAQTLDVPVVLNGLQTIAASGNVTINGPVSGSGGGLTVSGSGAKVTLSGNNSYTGGTTVSAGTLVLSGNNLSATGGITNSDTLQLQNTNAIAGSMLALNSGSILNLRADADTTFAAAGIAGIANSAAVTINADQITSGGGNGSHTLSLTNGFSMGANATVNVTGGSGDALTLGTISIAAGNANTETLSVDAGVTANLGGVTASGTYDNFGFSGAGNMNVVGAVQETASSRWLGLLFNQSGTVTFWAANSLRSNNTGTSGNPGYSPTISFNSGVTVFNHSAALNMNSYFGSIVALGAISGSSDVTLLLGGTDSHGLAGGITLNPPLMVGGASWPYYNGSIYAQAGTSGTLRVGGQNTNGVNTWACNFTLGPANWNDLADGKSLTLVAAPGGEVDFTGQILANGSDTSAGITVGDTTYGGTVKIAGVNTYLGGTVVNAGTLLLSSALTGTTATGSLTVNDGGILAVIATGTSQLSPLSLTLGSSSGASNNFLEISSTTTAPIHATNLIVNGVATINIKSGTFQVGQTYPLIAYDNGGGTVVLGSLPTLVQGYLTDNGSLISLTVTGMTSEIWSGAANGTWDALSLDWKTNGITGTYLDGARVVFDDMATGTTSITNIPAVVSPFSFTVSNSSKAYSFAGGIISGSASLTKTGNGTLTLANTNTYAGGTVINNGTLQLGDGLANNGVVAGGITDDANLVIANPLDQTFANPLTGSGNLAKVAAGTLTVSGANDYSGTTTVKQGTLSFSTVNNLGTNTVVLGDATMSANATLQLTGAITVSNNVSVAPGAGARTLATVGGSTFSGAVALNNNVTARVTGSGDSHLSGSFTGSGNVTVSNTTANIVWLDGSSSPNWTGALIIQAGTVRPGTSVNQFNTNTVLSISASNGANFNIGGINANLNFAGINDISGATGGNLGGGSSVNNVVLGGGGNYTYSGTINSALWGVNIAMGAGGQQTLTGTNTYAGATTVSSGSLWIAGSGSVSSAVNVNGGTFGGTGTVSNSVTVNSGGTLSPGAGGSGALTVNSNLALHAGSTNTFAVNGSTPSTTAVVVGGTATYGGVLNIVPTGSFTNGQKFTLFSGNGTTNAGNFASILGSPGNGLAFSFTNGGLSVVAASPGGPATITNSINGNTLNLTWPSGQGWTLQSQTNRLSTGLSSTGWGPVSGAADGGCNITVDPANPAVFYRLTK